MRTRYSTRSSSRGRSRYGRSFSRYAPRSRYGRSRRRYTSYRPRRYAVMGRRY